MCIFRLKYIHLKSHKASEDLTYTADMIWITAKKLKLY